jgi:hypothetical protein
MSSQSNMPESARRALEAAEAEYNAMYADSQVVNAPELAPGETGEAVVVNQMTASEAMEHVANKEAQQAQTPPQQEPQTQQPEQPVPTPTPDPWEHKFKVLQGKYNSEVPRLNAQLQQALASVQDLTDRVNALASQPQAAPAPEPDLDLTAEEQAAYGEDLIKLARKIAAQEASKATRDLRGKVDNVDSRMKVVSQETEQQAQERFLSTLDQTVPDWRDVNVEDGWLQWLGQYDPMLRKVRQDALNEAAASRDAQAVAAMFGAYRGTQPTSAPSPTQPPLIQQQVAAPRTTAATPQSQGNGPTKRLYTEGDINALFSAKRRGEYTTDQWKIISSEIDAAVMEGRVR